MKATLFCKITLLMTFIMSVCLATIVLVSDPFMVYRIKGQEYMIDDSYRLFYNYGLAKYTDYNMVITGSCMTRLFDEEDFPFDNAVKLNSGGTFPKDIAREVSAALSSDNNVDRILFNLDIWTLDEEGYRAEYPEYIWDVSIYNDIKYLLNKDVILKCMNVQGHQGQSVKWNPIKWGDNFKNDDVLCYGEKYVLESKQVQELLDIIADSDGDWESKMLEQRNCDDYTLAYVESIIKTTIVPIIEANPDIRFDIVFPPYSILYFSVYYNAKSLGSMLEKESRAIEVLDDYENVNLWYLRDSDIICNLGEYADYNHYSEKVSEWMAECIESGDTKFLVDGNNKDLFIDKLYKTIIDYDLYAILNKVN